MDSQTPISGGDQSNAPRGQPWQSLQPANPIVDGNGAADSDRYFRFHELGDLVKHYPSAHARGQGNEAQGGIPGAYISQPTTDPQTCISEGGDCSKALRVQPLQSFQAGNPIGDGNPAANSDRCYRSGELGHWMDCPSANVRAQSKAAQAGGPGAYVSQSTMQHPTPISKGGDYSMGQPRQSVQPGNPVGDGSLAAKSDRCFRCNEFGHWAKDCSSVNVRAQCNAAQAGDKGAYNSQPTMDPQTPTSEGDYTNALSGRQWQSLRHANPIGDSSRASNLDKCFRCHELGHWAKDCHWVNVRSQCNASQGGDPGAYRIPEKLCPCCGGACLILTSNTPANPGRKFYRCPVRKGGVQCRFFQWCDAPVSFPRQSSPGGDGGFRGQPATPTQISPVAAGGGFRGQLGTHTHNSPGVGGFRRQSATPTQDSPGQGGEGFKGQLATHTENSPGGGFRGQSATPTQDSPGGGGFRGQSATPPQKYPGALTPGDNGNRVGIVGGYDHSTRCPCGAGPCPVRTCKGRQYVGRQYVTCPVRKGEGSCRFFKWCDNLDSTNIPLLVTSNDFTPKHKSESSRRNGACFKCRIEGHWRKDCPRL